MQILFLIPYPLGGAPSQRFRFEQYFKVLKKHGLTFDYQCFIDGKTWKILYKKGYFFQKALGILVGFLRRIKILFFLNKYDFVFIHREAAPLLPPVFEYLIACVSRKKIIFDFDDAIWLPNTSEQNRISAFLKFHQKTGLICKWAYKVSAGNDFLCDYARAFTQNVVLNPTTIDTKLHKTMHPIEQKCTKFITIGWTGSHSTMKYLDSLVPILQEIETNYAVEFLVISNQNPHLRLLNFKFVQWNKETEIEDLSKIQIGVMPLTDDEWARGKCGFKALQYMSLGIPALASPVGVNTKIIKHGENGFLCGTDEEWKNTLIRLIENENLRTQIGINSIQTIENEYSVKANEGNFLSLFT
jgi:glycosyltransferase involved in cell wall biosynthesis